MSPSEFRDPVQDDTLPDSALHPSDTALLVAVARRRREALAELYRRHGDAVYSAACAVCGPKKAEEATRQVFVQLWWEPGQVECDRRSLRSHLLIQAYRRATELGRADTGPVAGADLSPWASTTMSDHERLAVVVTRFGGGTYREVARLLDLPEAQTRGAIRNGLRHLHRAMVGATP